MCICISYTYTYVIYILYAHICVRMFIDAQEFVIYIYTYIYMCIYALKKQIIQQCMSDKQQQTHLIGSHSIHFIYRYIIIAFIFYNYIYNYIYI